MYARTQNRQYFIASFQVPLDEAPGEVKATMIDTSDTDHEASHTDAEQRKSWRHRRVETRFTSGRGLGYKGTRNQGRQRRLGEIWIICQACFSANLLHVH